MKRILSLGAGLVSKPLVRYFLETPGFKLTVATRTVSKAEAMIGGHPDGKAVQLNVEDEDELARLIQNHDLVISLLPYRLHPLVAQLCIRSGKPMATTSYVSERMKQLDDSAKKSGIIILNEAGVDPGIDHMSAMKIVDQAREEGWNIISFRSYCGGLPAPEANTNPFGYKFSWSPMGVLLAAKNSARYLKDGKVVNVASEDLFNHYHLIEVSGVGCFEAYPNRDSIPYKDVYGLNECREISRWTLRNISHCQSWYYMVRMGLLSEEKMVTESLTYREFMRKVLEKSFGVNGDDFVEMLEFEPELSLVVKKLKWLGMFDDEKIDMSEASPVEIVSRRMQRKMRYDEGERDMIVMQHRIVVEKGGRLQFVTSTMVDYGIGGGDSAMARTVSLPVAIASRLIAEGRIKASGVVIPTLREIYLPVLSELKERFGIECVEKRADI